MNKQEWIQYTEDLLLAVRINSMSFEKFIDTLVKEWKEETKEIYE